MAMMGVIMTGGRATNVDLIAAPWQSMIGAIGG